MHLLQYSFSLPDDFAMSSIRGRVEAKRHLFDNYPGLVWKAWLLRERGVEGATDHRYAPLYLFNATAALTEFLSGPLYQAVTDTYGWVQPAGGVLMNCAPGDGTSTPVLGHAELQLGGNAPSSCSIHTHALTSHATLAELAQKQSHNAAYVSVWMLDISALVAREYRFWAASAGELDGERRAGAVTFEVAALSTPKT